MFLAKDAKANVDKYRETEAFKMKEATEKYAESVGRRFIEASEMGLTYLEVARSDVKSEGINPTTMWITLIKIICCAGYTAENNGDILVIRW